MRIAYLTSQYPAPSHTFIRREVQALRRAGLDIATFSVRRPAPEEMASDADIATFRETVYILPASPITVLSVHAWALSRGPLTYFRTFALAMRHRAPGAKALAWAFFHFVEAMVLARQLHRAGVSRLHNHFANSAATVGMLAAHVLDLPWSMTLHGISETDYPAGLLLPAKLARVDFAACASWFGRAQAMRISDPALWDRLFLVRCAVETASLTGRWPRQHGENRRYRIVTVGRLSAEKGQMALIDVFANLVAKGHDAELVLVGAGPLDAALKARVAQLGIGERVQFLGRLPEEKTLGIIATSDLFVLPSFMEGLPVVLMEAMALGVPVISSQLAGVPELVIDGITGVTFAASDWSALAAALQSMMTRSEEGLRMAEAAKIKVAAEFDIDRAILPLLDRFGRSL
jgi:glycosyltransferase involved in cell wall biosynthesis